VATRALVVQTTSDHAVRSHQPKSHPSGTALEAESCALLIVADRIQIQFHQSSASSADPSSPRSPRGPSRSVSFAEVPATL
jgi:hypothetical protein